MRRAMRPSPASRAGCSPARRSARSPTISTRRARRRSSTAMRCWSTDRPSPAVLASAPAPLRLRPSDLAVAALVLDTGEPAGRGVDRAVPTEWQFHPVSSGRRGDRGDRACPRRRRPAGPSGPAAVARQSARPGGAGAGARAARGRGARLRPRPRTRPGPLGAALLDRPGSQAAAEGDHRGRRRAAARRGGDKALVATVAAETTRIERYISNLLELGPDSDQRPLEIGGVTIDLFRRAVFKDGDEVHLTPKEYAVLAELAKHPGRVLTHAHLLRRYGARRRRGRSIICAWRFARCGRSSNATRPGRS